LRRKTFVIDTSVLLYDSSSIFAFTGNDVVIPLIALEELDRFKDRKELIGSAAREVNRTLDTLRKRGSLHEGIELPEHEINIRVVSDGMSDVEDGLIPREFDLKKGDHKLLWVAAWLRHTKVDSQVIVVTKDINLRIKADAIGIPAEDYYKDVPQAVREGNPVYSGQSQMILSDEDMDSYYQHGWVTPVTSESLCENSLVVGVSETNSQKSLIGMVKGGKIVQPKAKIDAIGITPRSKEQKAAVHLLTDGDVPLVAMTGLAGSGKTFLALTAGMAGLNSKKYERIIITRSIEPVGRDLGFLPGTLDEKMAPWLMPIVDNFRNAFKDTTYFETMRQRGIIEVSPISYIRGRSFSNCYIIVDEAQNLTIHEIKTLVTRCGEGTKMVLLGDTEQVDTPYLDRFSNGLTIAIERLKGSQLFGHIRLDRGERSPLATLASQSL
jgi:PhoH-like ATPase